jgi:hypothetical protein
LKRHLR